MTRIHGLRSSGYYPPGAEYDVNAPFNEVRKKVQVCVSITYHKTIEVEVEGSYDKTTLYNLVEDIIYPDTYALDSNGWFEDEFEITEE